MIPFQYALRDEFLEKSIQCNKSKKDRIKNSKEFILWAETKIDNLHEWLKTHDFANDIEEIKFFKEIKPCIISKLIYQKEILRIATSLPSGKKLSLKFYEKEHEKIAKKIRKDPEFYAYYRSDSNELDNAYFTRKQKRNIINSDSNQISPSSRISTNYDGKVSTILAYDRLIVYIEKRITKLKNKIKEKKKSKGEVLFSKSKLQWTRKESELIEFVYAFHFSKYLNHGNTDLKEIAKVLGRAFNMNIKDNFYRTYKDVKSRKNQNSKVIQTFASEYQKKLDEENF